MEFKRGDIVAFTMEVEEGEFETHLAKVMSVDNNYSSKYNVMLLDSSFTTVEDEFQKGGFWCDGKDMKKLHIAGLQ